MSKDRNKISDELVDKFVSKPESFLLYRGEGATNQGGLHFTTDKRWAERFGGNVIGGTLPTGSKIKLITLEDMEKATLALLAIPQKTSSLCQSLGIRPKFFHHELRQFLWRYKVRNPLNGH